MINNRIVSLVCVLFFLFAAGQVMADSVVGSWLVGDNSKADGASVFVFLANGYYFQIQNALDSDAPHAVEGFERGTYNWNATTGAINFTTLQDTNGDAGLSAPGGTSGWRFVVAGDVAIITIPGSDSFTASRITSSIPIVGGWFLGDTSQADSSVVLVFLPNGVYFFAADLGSEGGGQDGIEHGIYTWDEANGHFTSRRVPAPYVDTNGTFGLSDPPGELTLTVSADKLSLNIVSSGGSDSLTRIGAPSSVNGDFQINAGLDDAWKNPATSGQGFFVTVFPEIGKIFLAWFTYDLTRPDASVTAQLGEPGHRWLTAFGSYSGNSALLDVEITEGGIFDASPPVVSQHADGTILLEFSSCNAGTVTYDIPSVARQGVVPIQRVTLDNMLLCESLESLLQIGQ